VKKNLARGIYNGKAHEMLEDIELVFQNCQTYTGYDKTSEYARTADTIRYLLQPLGTHTVRVRVRRLAC
jgi:predicted Zn-dependent peptidase